jgi:hypothetical protein
MALINDDNTSMKKLESKITIDQRAFLDKLGTIAQTYLPEKMSLVEANRRNLLNVFPYLFLTKYLRTYEALLLLIDKQYTEDGDILLRSLFEIWVKVLRISDYPNESSLLTMIQFLRCHNRGFKYLKNNSNSQSSLAFDYQKEDVISDQKIRYYIDELKKVNQEVGEKIEADYQSNPHGDMWWPSKRTYDLLKENNCNTTWFYEYGYKNPSNIVHSNAGVLLPLYCNRIDENIVPRITPDGNHIDAIGMVASGMLIDVLDVIDRLYQLSREKEMALIKEEYAEIFELA